jgi:hypothetical protein
MAKITADPRTTVNKLINDHLIRAHVFDDNPDSLVGDRLPSGK